MFGDPGLVVGGRLGAARDGRTVGADDADLIGRVDLPAAARRGLGPFAALAAAAPLREQRRDPGAVDEVRGAAECGEQDQIEEDAADI